MCVKCNTLLDRLMPGNPLIETGVDGLYGRSGKFEDVIVALRRAVSRFGAEQKAEVIRFPPGMNPHCSKRAAT
jgi:hypothetical protein